MKYLVSINVIFSPENNTLHYYYGMQCVGVCMCGCVYIGFLMCGCVYVWFCNLCGCVYVWVL